MPFNDLFANEPFVGAPESAPHNPFLGQSYGPSPTYGTNMPSISPDGLATTRGLQAAPLLDQAGYFEQNPDAGFGDWLNYTQNKTTTGEFQAPSSLAPGFLQSQYAPGYNNVLSQFNDPNYNRNEDPNNLSQLMNNWSDSYTAGKPYQTWQSEAAKSAQGTPIIGGGKYGLDAATVGQMAVGGFGGAAMGAGVGMEGAAGAGAGTGLIDAGTGLPALDAGVAGGAAGSAAGGFPGAITTPLINAGISAGIKELTGTPAAGTPAGGLLGTGVNSGQGSLMGTIGAGLGAAGQYKNAQEIRNATQQGIERQDPFGGQRAQYQGMLANSYNDPNFFANNPTMQGLRDTAMNATDRRMAAGGYNMSGRQMDELNKSGLNESFKYALPFQQQLAQNAGANIQPGNVGDLSLRGAQAAGTADLNAQGGAMNFLANLFGGGNAAGQNIPGLTPQIQSYLQNLFGPGNGGGTMPTLPNSNVTMPDFGNEMPLPTEDYGQYF